ncbi:MAG: branched-chain amino acid transaminase [Asticcacaulis sp.]|uniref:branched-chain amino acid transaminase n=1 Tax=Asticcacaulis tiandongensis TaxID=2565365 RepID=UPI001129BDD8|nr:branched-chain amino acid transaminase [Asticcacaulis tiandongensis]
MKPLAEKIWFNGELKQWEDAKIHVLTHALHYGTGVFEGIRAYDTPKGSAVFRLTEHNQRLLDSARIYHLPMAYTVEQINAACKETLKANGLKSAYLRPIAFLGECGLGVTPKADNIRVDVAIAAFPWGAYLGEDGLTKGVDVCVSSWQRVAPNTIPAAAKASGNYLSSYLIGREARTRGYAEGLGLGTDGRLSEGAGENLFVILNGKLHTPPVASSILGGITRDTVLTLARAEGIEIVEQALPREMLYLANEVFMTGTAAEITPIRSIDDIPTRAGGPGEITKLLQARFSGLFNGQTEDKWGWLDYV